MGPSPKHIYKSLSLYGRIPPQYLNCAEWRISPDVFDEWKKQPAYTDAVTAEWQCLGLPINVDDRLAPGTVQVLLVIE